MPTFLIHNRIYALIGINVNDGPIITMILNNPIYYGIDFSKASMIDQAAKDYIYIHKYNTRLYMII